MRSSLHVSALAAAATVAAADPRFIMYYDQYHLNPFPGKDLTAGVNYVITAFANSSIFNEGTDYKPSNTTDDIRQQFDDDKRPKVCMAIGGWGDLNGFHDAIKDDSTIQTYADNVAKTLDELNYDCVDVDWEYPGGNGEDYKVITNDQKTDEIPAYPKLLQKIKDAIGDKELSIAVPAREADLFAYTAEQMPDINKAVDFINVMSYDIMNRRDDVTNHASAVVDCKAAVERYLSRGADAAKLNLGFPFYAKFFKTDGECDEPVGCKTVLLEFENGTDTQQSGAETFEPASFDKPEFAAVMEKGQEDSERGGQWYWDPDTSKFWTWDTPELVTRKFDDIVKPLKLGGAFAWSMAEDSHDWSHLKAMQEGVKGMTES